MRTIYRDIVQGTAEWHAARLGILTASQVNAIITPGKLEYARNATSRALVCDIASQRIAGFSAENFASWDMRRGHADEIHARAIYSRDFEPVEEVGFIAQDSIFGHRVGYSPDGLVGDDGLIEIKSPTPKHHLRTIIDDDVPAEHIMQVQAGLLISGRAWLDYVSYCGGMRLWVRRVYPDAAIHAAIIAAARQFESAVREAIETYEQKTANFPLTERHEYIEDMVI